MAKIDNYRDFNEILREKLKSQSFTIGYLNEALNGEDGGVFLLSFRHVIGARGGIEALAKKLGVSQQDIEQLFSEENAAILTEILKLFKKIGIKAQFVPL
jgi:DNA-binding phage protein